MHNNLVDKMKDISQKQDLHTTLQYIKKYKFLHLQLDQKMFHYNKAHIFHFSYNNQDQWDR